MTRRRFTIVELMIVVAIISILSAIAIPSFHTFMARSKAAEVDIVVDGIALAQRTYHANAGELLNLPRCPLPAGGFGKSMNAWSPCDANWVALGFSPDGDVRGGYGAQLYNDAHVDVSGVSDVDGDYCTYGLTSHVETGPGSGRIDRQCSSNGSYAGSATSCQDGHYGSGAAPCY